jgi:hypothetical protein
MSIFLFVLLLFEILCLGVCHLQICDLHASWCMYDVEVQ